MIEIRTMTPHEVELVDRRLPLDRLDQPGGEWLVAWDVGDDSPSWEALHLRRDASRYGQVTRVRISAKADYAIRAAAELAAAPGLLKGEQIAAAQSIPVKFLENILAELRHAGIVASQRGAEGGYSLARPAEEVTLADVIRAVDGPLANVRGMRPERAEYAGAATNLRQVWIALRQSMRAVLETVTLADLARGDLPEDVAALAADPEAWRSR